VKARAHRADGAASDLRDLLVAVPFNVGEQHDLTLFGCQVSERL
jgi:hypothetical protein